MLLRINVWISFNSLQKGAYSGISFPYVALHPSTGKKGEYRSIKDVYDEIIRLSEEAEKKGFDVGESIYMQSFFFVDHALLVDKDCQDRIREYTFCKKFSCSPYPSLNETPANIIDDFLAIDEEFTSCVNKQNKEN